MLSNILNIYCKNIFNNFLIAESCRTRTHLFQKLPSPAPAPESWNAPVLHREWSKLCSLALWGEQTQIIPWTARLTAICLVRESWSLNILISHEFFLVPFPFFGYLFFANSIINKNIMLGQMLYLFYHIVGVEDKGWAVFG